MSNTSPREQKKREKTIKKVDETLSLIKHRRILYDRASFLANHHSKILNGVSALVSITTGVSVTTLAWKVSPFSNSGITHRGANALIATTFIPLGLWFLGALWSNINTDTIRAKSLASVSEKYEEIEKKIIEDKTYFLASKTSRETLHIRASIQEKIHNDLEETHFGGPQLHGKYRSYILQRLPLFDLCDGLYPSKHHCSKHIVKHAPYVE
jgi:hypothetical protein